MSRTLLSLHAHPDDESSKGAATVALYVEAGVRAVLVTATGGEAGDILNPAMDTPEVASRLPEVRAAELAQAAAIIGYDDVVLLGYRDSGMPDSADNARSEALCNQPHDAVLERLVRIVRTVQPQVVLGYDDHEFYPHPDHLAIHRLSLDLFGAAADENRFPDAGPPWQIGKLYAPVFTGDRIGALHGAMLERTGRSPYAQWIERMDLSNGLDRRITRIDVSGYIERGRDALRAHRTQVDPDGFWFEVPTELVEEVYPWEDFELLASSVPVREGETDLFEGLT
ncbi:MAG TPA: mycothiol conjugate amidase Mca [Acidimicrobiia bacterium]|nr:mycothiol conjugate amidase Mca [Acidimicrobiia bacterium]